MNWVVILIPSGLTIRITMMIKALTGGTFTITAKDDVVQSMTITATGGGKSSTSSAINIIGRKAMFIIIK